MKDGNTYPQDNKKRSSPSLDFIVGSIFTCVFLRNNLLISSFGFTSKAF
jgi:hypothetical protein